MIPDEIPIDFRWIEVPEVGEESRATLRRRQKSAPRREAHWRKKYPELPDSIISFLVRVGIYINPRTDKNKETKARIEKDIERFFLAVNDCQKYEGYSRRAAIRKVTNDLIAKNTRYGRSPNNIFTMESP